MEISNTVVAVIGTAIVTAAATALILQPMLKRHYKNIEEGSLEREKEIEKLKEGAQALKAKADSLKELAESAESKAEVKVKEARRRITDLEKEMQDLHLQMSTMRVKHIEDLATAKTEAYEQGIKDGTKDFSISCQPYSIDKSEWMGLKSKYELGYRYQLLIKGAPAFDSKDVKVQEVDKIDEAAQKALLDIMHTAAGGFVNAGINVITQKALAAAKG